VAIIVAGVELKAPPHEVEGGFKRLPCRNFN